MAGITKDELDDLTNRQNKKRKADGSSPNCVTIGPRKITIVEIGYVAETRYDDKLKAKIQQHKVLCDLLTREWRDVEFCPIILGTQGSVLKCFSKAMLA